MKKEEVLYRTIAEEYLKKTNRFTQLGLSKELNVSISTVNNAVKNLQRINAVRIKKRSFFVTVFDRLMMFWATHRNLKKDIIYSTRSELSVKEIEGSMPPQALFTAYSAYRMILNDAPADYSETYVYASEDVLKEIKRRFPQKQGSPNVIVLKPDYKMEENAEKMKGRVSLPQVFVDLWNISTWYAKEYSDALEKKIMGGE